MTRAQVREFAPYLGMASVVVGVVAFLAALLGVTLSGPGQRLNALEPRVDSLEARWELVEGTIAADCLDPETAVRLVRARVPCAALLRKAGIR